MRARDRLTREARVCQSVRGEHGGGRLGHDVAQELVEERIEEGQTVKAVNAILGSNVIYRKEWPVRTEVSQSV